MERGDRTLYGSGAGVRLVNTALDVAAGAEIDLIEEERRRPSSDERPADHGTESHVFGRARAPWATQRRVVMGRRGRAGGR